MKPLAFLAVCWPLPVCLAAEGHPPTRTGILTGMATTIPQDCSGLVTYPVDHPDHTAGFVIGIGALVLFDKPITRAYQDHVEPIFDGFHLPDSPLSGIASPVERNGTFSDGDGWPLVAVGSTYLGGFLCNDAKAQETGLAAAKAMGYSLIISQLLLKSLSGRNRPTPSLSDDKPSGPYTDDPYDFGHLHWPEIRSRSEESAMPSYHFTMVFSAARVYHRAYGSGWIPYGTAAVLLASDIRSHHHWVSDMVAGALIGTAIGSVVSDPWFADESKAALEPTVDSDGVGMQLTLRF